MEVNWQNLLEILALISGIATVFGMFLAPTFWLASKIDAFRVEVRQEIGSLRSEFRQDMSEFRKDMDEFRKENRDFHGRLCAIEERNKNVSKCDSNSVAKTKKVST